MTPQSQEPVAPEPTVQASAEDEDDFDETMDELEPIFSEGEYADASRELYKMDVHLDQVSCLGCL